MNLRQVNVVGHDHDTTPVFLLALLALSAFVLEPAMNTSVAQPTVVLDSSMWTGTAYLALVLVPAMNASVTNTTLELESTMFATAALFTSLPDFAMRARSTYCTVVLQLAMSARTANSAHATLLAVLTTNALLFLRSAQTHPIVVICRGQATLHREQAPMLFATYLEIMIGRIQFQELAEQGVENLQGWMNLGISQIQVIQA